MPTPFCVANTDHPDVSLGCWDDEGNITIPGNLTCKNLIGHIPGGGGVTIPINADVAASGDPAINVGVTGNAVPSLAINGDGSLNFSDGTDASDVSLSRSEAGQLDIIGSQGLLIPSGIIRLGTHPSDTSIVGSGFGEFTFSGSLIAGAYLADGGESEAFPVFWMQSSANQSVTSSTTLVSSSEGLGVDAPAGTYWINGFVVYEAIASAGIKYSLTLGGSATTFWWRGDGINPAATTSLDTSDHGVQTTSGFTTAGGAGATTPLGINIQGFIVTSNPVSFEFQFAQATSQATATTVLAGSWFTLSHQS